MTTVSFGASGAGGSIPPDTDLTFEAERKHGGAGNVGRFPRLERPGVECVPSVFIR